MTELQPSTAATPTDPGTVAMLTRDFTAGDITELRHTVARFAADNGLTDLTQYRFVLAVHEIAVNAVKHGGGRGHLELWHANDQLHCRITDPGPGMPARALGRAATHTTTGRGLWLAQHACQMTTTSSGAGTTVTLTCPITPADGGGEVSQVVDPDPV